MLFSKQIILTMAVAIPLSVTASRIGEISGARKLKKMKTNNNKPKKPKKSKLKKPASNPTAESYRIVSSESDLYFIPATRYAEKVNSQAPPEEIFSLQGSQFLQNGAVYDAAEITVEDGQIVGTVPDPTAGSSYNSQCTAMDGVSSDDGSVEIYQNMCDFNLCVADKGCLSLRSGGPFVFNPFDTDVDAVPTITAIILGGTGGFSGYSGTATIDLLSRTADGGFAVSQIDLML